MRAASFEVPPSRVPSVCGEDIFDCVGSSKGVFSSGQTAEGDMAHDIATQIYRYIEIRNRPKSASIHLPAAKEH